MARRVIAVFIVLAGLLAGSLPVQAGAPISAANNTLYGLRVGTSYVMGPNSDEAGHQAGAWGASNPAGVGGAPYAMSGRDWAFTLIPDYATTLQLDPVGKVEAHVWIGGDTGEFGQFDVSWKLAAGSTVLATGAKQALQYTSEIKELTWSVAPVVTSFKPADGDLVFTVTVSGSGFGIRINLAADPGWTRIILPVLSTAASATKTATTYQALTGSFVDVRPSLNGTKNLQLNWTSPIANATVSLAATVSKGSTALTMFDAAGAKLVSRVLANGTADLPVHGKAGPWRILLNATGFAGSVHLQVRAPDSKASSGSNSASTPGPPSATSTAMEGGDMAASLATGSGTSSTSQGTPALGLPFLVAAGLGAVALVRRRRA